MGRRALVTGAAGFIGSHIVDRLLREGSEVTAVDNLSAGKIENVAHNQGRSGFTFLKGDIRDAEFDAKIVRDVDTVFHEAALVSVTRSVKDPVSTNETNVSGTLRLLRACANSGVRRFIYASSSSVYGETETLPKTEGIPPQPISPYAVSKLAGEDYCRVFHRIYGLETVSLRYFNVYGPRQAYGPYSGVITIFINRLLEGKPPIIYGDGEQTRDFTHIQDVVEANMLAAETNSGVGEVFNIATGKPATINELCSMLLKITDRMDLNPEHTGPRPGDIKHSYADTTKARETLGYRPRVSLEQGLVQLTEWFSGRSKKN